MARIKGFDSSESLLVAFCCISLLLFACGGGSGSGSGVNASGASSPGSEAGLALNGSDSGGSIQLEEIYFGRPLFFPSGLIMKIVNPASLIETDPLTGSAFYSFAEDGTLIYVPGGTESTVAEGTSTLLWVDFQGSAQPITEARRGFHLPRVSPDGKRLLTTIEAGDRSDVWAFDPERDTLTRLTFEGSNGAAIWTSHFYMLHEVGLDDYYNLQYLKNTFAWLAQGGGVSREQTSWGQVKTHYR